MKVNFSVLLLAFGCCLLFAPAARATDYAYGYTSIYVDGNTVRGYHRTEVDYNTEVYYTPYVCGSLYKDGVEVVRSCQAGMASATRNTQAPYFSGSSYSALSDHYVNIEYEEEDPYNPGYYYYPDSLGYFFSGGGSQPIDWYYFASGIYNERPDESIRLGDTNVQLIAITLSVDVSPAEVQPSGIGGTSTATITVSTSPATSGKSITFSAVAHNNGGHVGHTGVRPVGSFNPSQGITGGEGKLSTTYTSAIFGGGVDITARISSTNATASQYLEVRVPDLGVIATTNDWNLVGQTPTHPDNHYGTATTNVGLAVIARDYNDHYYGVGQYPPSVEKLRYNDMSLVNGGKFDLSDNWGGTSHQEHKLGLNCDVYSANVPTVRWGFLTATFVTRGSPNYLDETATRNHWHLRF